MNANDARTPSTLAYQSREEPESLYASAGKIWGIMLASAVVICVLSVAGGVYMLVITFLDMGVRHSQAGVPQSLNRVDLARVVGALNARQEYFTGLQSASSTAADPSR